jgi:hypothetical protein
MIAWASGLEISIRFKWRSRIGMTRIYIESAWDKNKPAGGNGEAVPSVILQSLGKLASVPSGSGSVCLPWGSVRFLGGSKCQEGSQAGDRSPATILPQQPILGPRCPDKLGAEGRALIHGSERPMWMAWLSEGQLLRMCECAGRVAACEVMGGSRNQNKGPLFPVASGFR